MSVTVCGTDQFAGVKISVVGAAVTSAVLALVTSRTTFEIGSVTSTTVKSSVVPSSLTSVPPCVSASATPATSSSAVTTLTIWSGSASKTSSEAAASTDTVTFVAWSPSSMSSSTPVSVTVWVTFQFAGVNVSEPGAAVTSAVLALTTVSTTGEAGWAARTTESASVLPASVTRLLPPDSVTRKPAASSSAVVIVTIWAPTPRKSGSEPPPTLIVAVLTWLPSMIGSFTPVTVTSCGVSHVADVNVSAVGLRTASPMSEPTTFNTTSLTGWVERTTENWSWRPASVTAVVPPDSVTENPATSSSAFVTDTAWLGTRS